MLPRLLALPLLLLQPEPGLAVALGEDLTVTVGHNVSLAPVLITMRLDWRIFSDYPLSDEKMSHCHSELTNARQPVRL